MKIEEQVLSREQMAHLKELGVDTSDASMYWTRAERMEGFKKHNLIDNDLGEWRLSLSRKLIVPAAWKVEHIPTYTIGDLIKKLPVCLNNKSYKRAIEIDGECIRAGYYEIFSCTYPVMFKTSTDGQSVKDMLYKLLCWVAENTYKTKLMKI